MTLHLFILQSGAVLASEDQESIYLSTQLGSCEADEKGLREWWSWVSDVQVQVGPERQLER